MGAGPCAESGSHERCSGGRARVDRFCVVSAAGALVGLAKQRLAPVSQTNRPFGAGFPGPALGGYQPMRFLYLLLRAIPPPAWAALVLLALAPGQRAFGTPVL